MNIRRSAHTPYINICYCVCGMTRHGRFEFMRLTVSCSRVQICTFQYNGQRITRRRRRRRPVISPSLYSCRRSRGFGQLTVTRESRISS